MADYSMHAREIQARDGAKLQIYHCGEGGERAVVFANAYGMPGKMAAPLAEKIARVAGLRFVTWETRGCPGQLTGESANLSPEIHAGDLLEILSSLPEPDACVVGWCSGVDVALAAASKNPHRMRLLVLVNGFLSLKGRTPTAMGTPLEEMMRYMAARPSRADFVLQTVGRSMNVQAFGVDEESALAEQLRQPFAQGPDLLRRKIVARRSRFCQSQAACRRSCLMLAFLTV